MTCMQAELDWPVHPSMVPVQYKADGGPGQGKDQRGADARETSRPDPHALPQSAKESLRAVAMHAMELDSDEAKTLDDAMQLRFQF